MITVYNKNKERIKDALFAVLIGAIVAFVTTFLEGALELLQGTENNILGGVAASIKYISKNLS